MFSAHRHMRNKNKTRLVLALLLWAVLLPGWALSAPLLLQGPVARTALEPHVSWLCDPSGTLGLEQIRQASLKPVRTYGIALGYRRGACWFHFRMENRSGQPLPLMLQLDFPVLDRVELFAPGSATPHVLTGDLQPFTSRPLATRAYVFPLTLDAGRQQDYFLRVATTSAFNIPLAVSSREHYAAEQEIESWINGAGFGIAIGLVIYHLFLWLAVRENVFRSYVLFVSSGFFFLLCFNGLAYRLWPNSPDWNAHAQLFFLCNMLAAATLVTRDYLGPGNMDRRAELALKLAMIVCAVMAWLQFAIPLEMGYPMQPLLTIPVVALIVYVTLPSLKRGVEASRVLLLGWVLLIAMALLLSLQALGIFSFLPIIITLRGVELTFILQQLLLALALADRLNALKREKAEQEQAALRAEAESAAKTEFLARMSHEIRTPMNALLGIAQLLQDTRLDKTQKRYVDTLLGSGHSLLHVIDDVLDYSKIVAGKVELEMIDFNLLDLLDECVQIFSIKVREKSISLVCERARDLPVYVCGDVGRLRQVLLNLLSNAIKFTEAGTVHLRASLDEQTDAHVRLHFEVEDSGIGIATEKLPLLFNSFTQADSSTSRQYGGTGLGLAICRQLVELMQGRISVSSALNQGSLFRFSVLLRTSALREAPAAQDALTDIRFDGAQALVVEDNSINQLVISGFLQKLGIRVRLAGSGLEALDILRARQQSFDVIFMDCEMPGMDGFEATRQLRQWERQQGVKSHVVIALTAHALPEHRTLCLAAGMDDYLSKPLLMPRLIERLRAALA